MAPDASGPAARSAGRHHAWPAEGAHAGWSRDSTTHVTASSLVHIRDATISTAADTN